MVANASRANHLYRVDVSHLREHVGPSSPHTQAISATIRDDELSSSKLSIA
jgi:hypothetical protein